jgi:type II secretory pathway component PulJ
VTLVEVMIASVIALIGLAALVTAYSATAGHSAKYLNKAHLHQQLYTLMHTMVKDIRRAGYWSFDPALHSATDNPFQDNRNRLRIQSYPGEAPDSCVLFGYDLDKDGLVGVGSCETPTCPGQTDSDNVEQFGFRLRNGVAQARYGGDMLSCASGYWQAVTDPEIEISSLVFAQHTTCSNIVDASEDCGPVAVRLIRRAVKIQLSGHSRGQPDTQLTLSAWVQVRNDQLVVEAE